MTTPDGPGLDVREADGRVTAIVTGCAELVNGSAEAIGDKLAKLIAGQPGRELVVDLARVNFLSSAALAQFLGLHRTLTTAGGRLSLINLQPDVRQVFAVTQLDRIIDVHPPSSESVSA